MLSELLKTAVEARGNVPQPDRQPGLSCSALFPCPYFMYRAQRGEVRQEKLTGQQLLNMSDGWTQEDQSVSRLREIGIIIKNRQARVTVGKSSIPGKIDGEVELDTRYLWEHKAWGSSRFDWFVMKGIEAYPGEKTQINAYMLGRGLAEGILYIKRKDNNDYYDVVVKLDKDFILPILEWADKIRLEGWTPEPKLCDYCAHCGLKCFGEVIDFSWITTADAPEMVEKWKQGDKYEKVGSMLKEEARTFFTGQVKVGGKWTKEYEGLIGDKDLLIVEGLKIKKIIQHRFDVTKERVLREFGPEGLVRVGEENDVVQYRISETEE